jgi:hypothetical protein
LAADDPGDVGAVPVWILALGLLAGEVHRDRHLAVERRRRRDAGVDYRDPDARARVPGDAAHHPRPDLVGANRPRGLGRHPHHRHVAREVIDIRILTERVELTDRDLQDRAVAEPLRHLRP